MSTRSTITENTPINNDITSNSSDYQEKKINHNEEQNSSNGDSNELINDDLERIPTTDVYETPVSKKDSWRNALGYGHGSLKFHFIALYGEFVGTFVFLFCSELIANIANHDWALTEYPDKHQSHPPQLVMIACGFGFSLMFSVWCFADVSGAAFNPAVSLTLALSRAISPTRMLFHWVAQMIAGMAASGAVSAITPGPILFENGLGLGCSKSRGVFLEMFGTSFLCITVIMTAIEKRASNNVAPLPIGISLFIIHLCLVAYTGCGVNPARSFGPCVAKRSFPHYHWIYWIGPLAGSFLAWGVIALLRLMDYTNIVANDNDSNDPDTWEMIKRDALKMENNKRLTPSCFDVLAKQ